MRNDMSSTRESRTWRTTVVAVIVIFWFMSTMAEPGMVWEAHPFAGPFIMLANSRLPNELCVSIILLGGILAPAARWAWTGKLWGAVVAIAVAALTIAMSYLLAASASC